jgi:DNA (cytosine-5)-methyltransferase 1
MTDKLNVLDLFAGAGGFTIAAEMVGGYETVAFCEIDKYAQKVLRKHWPDVPLFDDVTKLKGSDVGAVDVITGGFPCQDVSHAGKQLGTVEGDRSSLFREILRIAAEVREIRGGLPWLLMENVGNLIRGGNGIWFASVLHRLAEVGYDAEWHVFPASYIGACHERERVWIIAYPHKEQYETCKQKPIFRQSDVSAQFARGVARWSRRSDIPKPRVVRRNDGIPNLPQRIGLMGNAIVPGVAALFLKAISERLLQDRESYHIDWPTKENHND